LTTKSCKILQLKKNYNLLLEERQSYWRRLHPSKENILHCLHFCGPFLHADPDPGPAYRSITWMLSDEAWKRKVYCYLEALRDPELLHVGVVNRECTCMFPDLRCPLPTWRPSGTLSFSVLVSCIRSVHFVIPDLRCTLLTWTLSFYVLVSCIRSVHYDLTCTLPTWRPSGTLSFSMLVSSIWSVHYVFPDLWCTLPTWRPSGTLSFSV
jgi:hypothetical protein